MQWHLQSSFVSPPPPHSNDIHMIARVNKEHMYTEKKGKVIYILLSFCIAEMLNANWVLGSVYGLTEWDGKVRRPRAAVQCSVCSLTAHVAEVILTFLHQPGEGGDWEHALHFSEFSFLGSRSGEARCTHHQATCSASPGQMCCSRRGEHQRRSAVFCARVTGRSVCHRKSSSSLCQRVPQRVYRSCCGPRTLGQSWELDGSLISLLVVLPFPSV